MPTSSLLASPIQILLVATFTVTTKLLLEVFPARSVAVQVVLVFPIGNKLPEDGLQITTGDGSSASDTVTLKETEAPERLLSSPATLAGTISTGAVLSILIVTEALRGRPAAFVAEHVRTVPAVSVVRLVVVHPVEDESPNSGSVAVQLTDPGELFQPVTFGEGVTVGTITGAVVSNLVMTS